MKVQVAKQSKLSFPSTIGAESIYIRGATLCSPKVGVAVAETWEWNEPKYGQNQFMVGVIESCTLVYKMVSKSKEVLIFND